MNLPDNFKRATLYYDGKVIPCESFSMSINNTIESVVTDKLIREFKIDEENLQMELKYYEYG